MNMTSESSLLYLLVIFLSYFDQANNETQRKKEQIVHLYALALHIYNNFDLCLSIYFSYIKCGSYLLVELMYLLIRNVVCECNFAF